MSSLLLRGLMIALQIFDAVVNDLYLLLHHRHPPGKVVMLPDLPGQLVHFGFHDGLCSAVGDQDTRQGYCTGDDCGNNALYEISPLSLFAAYTEKTSCMPFSYQSLFLFTVLSDQMVRASAVFCAGVRFSRLMYGMHLLTLELVTPSVPESI